MNFKRVGVVGGGTMGAGIAQVTAHSGRDVVLVELSRDSAAAALKRVQDGLARWVKRDRITIEDAAAAMARVNAVTSLEDLSDVDLVVEALFEDVDLKKHVFADLDRVCRPGAILASNTSTIPLVILATATQRPDKVVGMHFFNPVPAMKLVEVIRTPVSSEDVVTSLKEFADELGKSPVIVNDVPGFVGNLLIVPFLLDAVRALERGVATKEAIDSVIQLGFNHPMGPFALSDLIGLDIVQDMAESMYEEYKDPKYFPPPLLKQLVRMGRLGRKTGEGFYLYDSPDRSSSDQEPATKTKSTDNPETQP
ncbi:3-hydroxyacyl-CoA dehydrogenase family protein [Rhodococcus koreensis]|uniref:3-hydroxyacyl-CoA dehydrogenase family protein n=1 Tax=Rhodococcus koreensis TaxID=99653 RepID=UPI00366D5D70